MKIEKILLSKENSRFKAKTYTETDKSSNSYANSKY